VIRVVKKLSQLDGQFVKQQSSVSGGVEELEIPLVREWGSGGVAAVNSRLRGRFAVVAEDWHQERERLFCFLSATTRDVIRIQRRGLARRASSDAKGAAGADRDVAPARCARALWRRERRRPGVRFGV